MKKENDWLVATINNPDFNYSQLKAIGLTADNTSLLSKDQYKQSPFVQEKFKSEESGTFDEAAFDNYYDRAAKSYNNFATDNFQDKLTDNYEYEESNLLRPLNGKVRQLDFEIEQVINPDRLQTGVSRVGVTDDRRFTASELAQQQKVYDWNKQEYRDSTPDDNTLFGNPLGWMKSIGDPLVMAQWDEDGEHIDSFSGKTVKHKKGELKLNESGTYYMETLANRSPYGKQVKSIFDSITKDTEKANKYDFLDSDGLDKSIAGSIAKTVLTVAPAFIPYVGQYYVAGLIGASLMDAIPTLYKMSFGMKEDTPTMNAIQGIGRSLRGSTSEYSQQNIVSTENFCNLISDVALQLAEQQLIFKGLNTMMGTSEKGLSKMVNGRAEDVLKRLKASGKYEGVPEEYLRNAVRGLKARDLDPLIRRNQRIAANVSLGYMAMLSGADAFEGALAQGATEEEAAAVTWGTIASIYAVDRLGLGEWMFDELTPDAKMIQLTSKALADKVKKDVFREVTPSTNPASKTWLYRLFDKSRESGKGFINNMKTHSLTLAQKSFTEGLEEVSEEFVSDLAKATFNLTSMLGYNQSGVYLDAFQDLGARYATSFVGGAVGGSIYSARDIALNGRKPNKNTVKDLVYIVQNNKTGEFLKEIDELERKGMLGNPDLGVDPVIAEDGTVSYLSADNADSSQNAAVANALRNQLRVVQTIIGEENLNLTEDQLIGQVLNRTAKLSFMMDEKNNYKSNLLNDFGKISNQIVDKRLELQKVLGGIKDSEKDSKGWVDTPETRKLTAEIDELRAKRDQILSGELSRYYVGEAVYGMTPALSAPFLAASFKQYASFKEKKPYNEIPEEKIASLQESYAQYQQSQQHQDLRESYDMFLHFNEQFSPIIANNGELYKNYGKVRQQFYDKVIDLNKSSLSYNVIPGLNQVLERRHLDPILAEGLDSDDTKEFLLASQKFIDDVVATNGGVMDIESKRTLENYLNRLQIPKQYSANPLFSEIQPKMFEQFGEDADGFWAEQEDSLLLAASDEDITNWLTNVSADLAVDLSPTEENIQAVKDLQLIALNDRLRRDIRNKLQQTQENPIYSLLTNMGVDMYDKKLNVFDLLKDEENRLSTIDSVSDYFITPERQQELDEAINIINMANSVILASQNFPASQAFKGVSGFEIDGFNKTLNQYAKFSKQELPQVGEVPADLGEMMRQDLSLVYNKVNYLKVLAEQNAVNQVVAHKQTEERVNKIISDLFTSDPVITGLNYNGISLVGSDLPLTGDPTKDSSLLLDSVYDNFKKIEAENSEVSKTAILEEMFGDIKAKFSEVQLSEQLNTKFNPKTETLTDYDLFELLLSSIAFKNSDFNYYLKQLLDSGDYKFAPFYSQSYSAKLALASVVDPETMNFGIKSIKALDPNSDLIPVYNTVLINGIGGAGKTTAVASLVRDISKMMNSSLKIWKVAPGETQLNNLKDNLGSEGSSFTIDKAIETILGSADLANDLKNGELASNFYDLIVFPETKEFQERRIPVVKTDLDYSTSNVPNIVFLDEATFLNSVYAQVLSNWAQKNNVAIILLGDLRQNGIKGTLKGGYNYYNVNPGDIITSRSPKLDISMRVTNIQKKDNTDKINATREALDATLDNYGNGSDEVVKSLSLRFYSGEDIPLNGERIVPSTTKEEVMRLLDDVEPLGYIYDDVNSPTYAIMQELQKEGHKIDMFTPEEVQGSERKYFVVDTHTEVPADAGFLFYNNFMSDLYTFTSRSKDGTLLIDNGISSVLNPDNFIQDERPGMTPDKTASINDFREFKLNSLEELIGNYKPSNMEVEVEQPVSRTEPPKKPGSATINPIIKPETNTLVEEVKNEITSGNTPADFDISSGIQGVRTYNFYMRSGLERVKVGNKTLYAKTSDADDLNIFLADKPFDMEVPEFVDFGNIDTSKKYDISGFKGLIDRYSELTGKQITTATNDVVNSTTIQSILNKLANENIYSTIDLFNKTRYYNSLYTQAEVNKAKKALYNVKTYLAFGRKFDDKVMTYLTNNGFQELANEGLNGLNNGKYKIKVSQFNEEIDYPVDKLNVDTTKFKEKVMFSLIYQLPSGKEITVGVLARPDTWNTYIDSLDNSPSKTEMKSRQSAYNKWWNEKIDLLKSNPGYIDYVDVPSESIDRIRLTRIVETGTARELTSFSEDNPNVIRSPLYIYAGKGEMERADSDKILNLSDSLRGKTVVFVCSDPNAVIDGERVDENNIARLYSRQKELSKTNPDMEKPIRFMLADPKGLDPIEFFNIKTSKIPGKNISKYLTTIGSSSTSAKIMLHMWNWRSNLIHFLRKVEDFKQETGVLELSTPDTRAKFNQWLKGRSDFKKFDDFIMLEQDIKNPDAAPQMSIVPNGNSFEDSKGRTHKKFATAITEDMAKAHITILDSIFDEIGKMIDLSNYDREYIILPKKDAPTFMEKFLGSSSGDEITVTSFGENGETFEESIPAFSFNTSYKAVRFLSNLYKTLYFPRQSKFANKLKTKDYKGNDVTINLAEVVAGEGTGLFDRVSEVLGDTSEDKVKLPSVFENMLRVILSGKVVGDAVRTGAPFKNGIYYHGVYSYENSNLSDYEDFYPAGNMEDQFTYSKAIELPVMDISADFGSLENTNSFVKLDRQGEFTSVFTEFSHIISNYGLSLSPNMLQELTERYNTEGDASLTQIYKEMEASINTALNDKISNGLKTSDEDFVLKATVTVDQSGSKIDVQQTLLGAIDSLDGNSLPKTNDGDIDFGQISEVTKLSSNNEKFLVTLKDNTEINVEYVNGEVKIQKISAQQIKPVVPNRDAKEFIDSLFKSPDDLNAIKAVATTAYKALEAIHNESANVSDIDIDVLTNETNLIYESSIQDADVIGELLYSFISNYDNATIDCSM